jgi:hypothetical protein
MANMKKEFENVISGHFNQTQVKLFASKKYKYFKKNHFVRLFLSLIKLDKKIDFIRL